MLHEEPKMRAWVKMIGSPKDLFNNRYQYNDFEGDDDALFLAFYSILFYGGLVRMSEILKWRMIYGGD